MNTTMNASDFISHPPSQLVTVLTEWYGATSSIRRLWAVDDLSSPTALERTLRIMIVVEPTADGSDTLPTWIANGRDWARELQERIGRPVRLELVEAPLPEDPEVELRNLLIASECWRDPTAEEY